MFYYFLKNLYFILNLNKWGKKDKPKNYLFFKFQLNIFEINKNLTRFKNKLFRI